MRERAGLWVLGIVYGKGAENRAAKVDMSIARCVSAVNFWPVNSRPWRGLDIRSALNYSTSLAGGHLLQF
jgi:hypothetical protein